MTTTITIVLTAVVVYLIIEVTKLRKALTNISLKLDENDKEQIG